ncbi:MAG: uridine phosphorylase [Chloroflexota bacterium]|jgi:uridine phosphorylase|nr:uridine phosphorylase [Chloroflexota bacterium]
MPDALLPVIRVPRGTVTPYVLTVGDPERAASISERLEDAREVGRFREYLSFQGTWQGVPLTVTSHGVGGAGAAVAFEELIQGGARTIIRLGTSGAFPIDIRSGDLLVATGAVREDGVSERLLPLAYPAICDIDVTRALIDAAKAAEGIHFGTGVMLTTATFYPGAVPDRREIWQQAHLAGVEMELATLLIVAALRGVRAGGIFTVDGNPAEEERTIYDYDPHRPVVDEGKKRMVSIGLDAIVRLARLDEPTTNDGGTPK